MDSKVRVTATAGEVIITSGNPEFGYIRVEQERTLMDDNGWARVKTLSALVPGTMSDLKKLGWTEGMFLPGKIAIKEQLTPFNKKDPDNNLKIAGKSGIVCRKGDIPIYRNTFYRNSPTAEDVVIPHTNVEEIREYYAVNSEDDESDTTSFTSAMAEGTKKRFDL